MSKRYLLLKASNYNWNETCPESWESTEWSLFSDRTYKAVLKYVPDISFELNHGSYVREERRTIREIEGSFSKGEFKDLLSILNEKWVNAAIKPSGCDGEAWQIKMLYPSGKTKKSSGKLGYIYGQPIEQLTIILNKIQEDNM